MGIITSGNTNIGLKRKTNQDSICLIPKHLFFAVADGMGGHNGGDIASQTTVKLFKELLDKYQELEPQEKLNRAIKEINSHLIKMSNEQPELRGMGTTVSGIMYKANLLYVANVGDSRTYLVHHHELYQLSQDHSLIQEKIMMGIYTREIAKLDDQKNVLVRTVGYDPQVEVDVFNYKICKNDIFIICSDGLHGYVSDREIIAHINEYLPEPSTAKLDDVKKAVDALIALANEKGGKDNVSVIISIAQA